MPVEPPPPLKEDDIVEFTIKGTLCGQTVLTVLHARFDNASEPDISEASDSFFTAVLAANGIREKYTAAAADNYNMNELVWQVIHPIRYARITRTVDYDGTFGGPAQTADLAAVIEKQSWFATDRKLKLNNGKFGLVHYGPVPTLQIDEGIVAQAYRDNQLDELAAKLVGTFRDDANRDYQWVVFHARAEPKSYTDVTSYSIKREARVMRRRTVGLGI